MKRAEITEALRKSGKLRRLVYLDYNATAPLRPEAREAMRPFLEKEFGNASSLHSFGQSARNALERARGRCADVLGCGPHEVVFTSGGTESDNLAIRGLAWGRKARGTRLVGSSIEHPAVRDTLAALKGQGFQPEFIDPEPSGIVAARSILDALDERTTVVTLMYANNETGTIQPVAEVGRYCRAKGILFHVDAVQAPGRLSLKVSDLQCDTIALSAHKFEGPKGVGLLYIREGVPLVSQVSGGTQENAVRAGTQNVAGIVGMTEALVLAEGERLLEAERLAGLRHHLESSVRAAVMEAVLLSDVTPECRLPNTSFFAFEGFEAEELVISMDLEGVALSTGSACSEGTHRTSPVLKAMKVSEAQMKGAVRFSLGRESSAADIDQAVEKLRLVVQRLRK